MFILDSVFKYIKQNACGVCIKLIIDRLFCMGYVITERDLLNKVLFIVVCDVTHYLHIKPLIYNYVYVSS